MIDSATNLKEIMVEKIRARMVEAVMRYRDAKELAGEESGFAKYQRGVLHTLIQIEKELSEYEL